MCSLLTSPVSPTLQLFVIIRRMRKLRSVTHATASRNWQNLDPNLGLAPKPGLKPLHRSTEDMGTGFAREGPALSGGGERVRAPQPCRAGGGGQQQTHILGTCLDLGPLERGRVGSWRIASRQNFLGLWWVLDGEKESQVQVKNLS